LEKETVVNNQEAGMQNWLSFGVVIASFVVQIMSLSFGAELFWMTDWNTFMWGIILGSVLLTALLCITGYIGLKMRIPTAVQYGNIFGQVGARIMNFFLLPAGIIWVAWMSDIAATSVQDIFPAVPYWTVVVAIVAISVFSTIRGVKGMEQSGYIQAPIVLVLVLITVVVILVKGFSKGTLELQMNSENTLSLLDSAVFVVLTWISVIQIFSDFTCGVKSTKDMTIGTSVGYGLLNAVMMFAGGVFAMVCGPEYSMVRGFTAGGIPQILVLVIVLLCSWTFNDRSFYSFGLAASVVVGDKMKPRVPPVVSGIAATAIALAGIMNSLYGILNVLGCLYAPLLGIYVSKYYVLGGMKDCTSDFSKMIKFDWLPFVPWAAGMAVGIVLPLIPTLTLNSSVASFVVSFVIYFVMCKIRSAVKKK
jgi:purine-cytosine permease-like protein